MRASLVFVFFVLTFALPACDQSAGFLLDDSPIVHLSATNLPRLGEGEGMYSVYVSYFDFNRPVKAASVLHEEGFMKIGEFNVSSDGSYLVGANGAPASFTLPPGEDPQLLDDIVITIESRPPPPDSGETGPILIGGKFQGDERTARSFLTMLYIDAFGTDFSGVRGSYTLAAPTSVPADSNSGVWFFQGSVPAPSLLNLPLLPDGWRYEGWVMALGISPPVFFSTGRFLRADSADYDGPGPGSGSGSGLSFPGQDFITGDLPRPDLSLPEYSFGVTVEPEPDNSETPFFLRILTSTTVQGAMSNTALRFAPTAEVSISR